MHIYWDIVFIFYIDQKSDVSNRHPTFSYLKK